MLKAVDAGVDPEVTGVLVDEQFGAPKNVPGEAKERGLLLAMPVEKSGQNEFDFEYGDDFGAHIEEFDPHFSKVLVRYNPEGDAEMNERQVERLKRLSDWLHENDRMFLFELLVPAEDEQLEKVDGDTDRFDAELRPDLMIKTIEEFQEAGVEADIWKIEGIDTQEDCERIVAGRAPRRPRRRDLRGARPRGRRRQGRPLAAPGRPGRGLRRVRDRAHDLVGRPQGLPRRRSGARGGRAADSRQLPALREGLRRGGEGNGRCVSVLRERRWAATDREDAGSLRGRMRMRQSLAQFEEAFREEAAESVVRRESLRKQAASAHAYARVQRSRKQGKLRFALLALSIVATAVIVTIVMFETLAMLAALGPPPRPLDTSCLPRPILLDLEVDLLAEDRHRPRRLDSDPDLFAHDRQDRDLDLVADHDRLIALTR